MVERINVVITVEAKLQIDKDAWPEGWNLKREIGHQLSFEDASEYEIISVYEK